MPTAMPSVLEKWLWRLERIERSRKTVSRHEAASAKRDLVADRSAFPRSYAEFEERYAYAIDALDVLSGQHNRSDDLLGVLASERKTRERDRPELVVVPDPSRNQERFAGEMRRMPAGLPPLLDDWVRRLTKHRFDLKAIEPEEAVRAEITLRNEAMIHGAEYARGFVRGYYQRALRELGDIATQQRPSTPGGRGPERLG